ncbi:polyribonucleotide nucleotidyltransferase [Pelagibacterales bacterium SAG-MED38]|nr:polyribonucleotide nucleotidyltransferase [Pelagibacterales bacterium SAG-MED38]MBD1141759.1 polyribonucleotide nucleotidyltransferase [Pelagibacterales bacterium SAG-MED32]
MKEVISREMNWGDQKLKIETGKVAKQATASTIVSYGDTVVMANVVAAKEPKPDLDFFPLTVSYQEKFYAAGKIPGGFFKREGRPTEFETLTSRLIDRPIRPLFPEGFKNETQVILTVLSHDGETNPDIVAMIAASSALTLSGVPFMGPIGGCRVGYDGSNYTLNPKINDDGDLDLVVAGTSDAVLMVESEAKQLSEEIMLGAVKFGHESMQEVIKIIINLAEECANDPWEFSHTINESLLDEIKKTCEDKIAKSYSIVDKMERQSSLSEIKSSLEDQYKENEEYSINEVMGYFKKIEKNVVRSQILNNQSRIDGRKLDEVRNISSEVSWLPRTHGSALFTRGETQAIVVATLGFGEDEQRIEALQGSYKENFMLHYNFPPYSVGEVGRLGATGRREIGHGKLAWRALKAVLPSKDDFDYTIRLVSDITESNGSSYMATVCGSSLALMDAGVPIKNSVSGIAMGLIKEGDDFAVLSDILGDEDHLGDMDFKVAGTKEGVTSLQMDIKITGITYEIMEKALEQAKGGRDYILNEMNKEISEARTELGPYTPRSETIKVKRDNIGEIIGKGGSTIKDIIEKSGAKIDISDNGNVKIAGTNNESIEAAKELINSIIEEPEVGQVYEGKVVKIMEFGAFVNFFGKRDGLVHISQLSKERVEKVTDVVNEGDIVKVKVLGFDKGKVKLSIKDTEE